MAKSKRQKVVSLTKTTKKTKDAKNTLIQQIRDSLDQYSYVYLFEVENMRNAFLKIIRAQWSDSKIFMGKNTVMAKAMGQSEADEVKENIRLLAERLVGNVGLLLSNQTPEEVLGFFEQYAEADYARTGAIATESIIIPAGPVMRMDGSNQPFPHTMESQLRSLGMPTLLKSGSVILNAPFTLCMEGSPLTSEQARLLKAFDIKLSHFRIKVICYYHDGQLYAIDREE